MIPAMQVADRSGVSTMVLLTTLLNVNFQMMSFNLFPSGHAQVALWMSLPSPGVQAVSMELKSLSSLPA